MITKKFVSESAEIVRVPLFEEYWKDCPVIAARMAEIMAGSQPTLADMSGDFGQPSTTAAKIEETDSGMSKKMVVVTSKKKSKTMIYSSKTTLVAPPTSNDNNMQWDAENERRMKALSDNPKQKLAVGRDAKITLLGSTLFSSQTLIMLDKAYVNQMKGTKLTSSDANERSLHLKTLRSRKLSELYDAIAKSKQDNVDGHKLQLIFQHLKDAKKKGDMLSGGFYETNEMKELREKVNNKQSEVSRVTKLTWTDKYFKYLYTVAYSLAKSGINPSSSKYNSLLQYLKDVSEIDTAQQVLIDMRHTALVESRSEAEVLVDRAEEYRSIAKGIKTASSNLIGRILTNTTIFDSDLLEKIKQLSIFGNDNNNNDINADSKVFLFQRLSPGIGNTCDFTSQRLMNVSCVLQLIADGKLPSNVHITEYDARGESGYDLRCADEFHYLLADIASTSPGCKIFIFISDETRGGRDMNNCRLFERLCQGLHPNTELSLHRSLSFHSTRLLDGNAT